MIILDPLDLTAGKFLSSNVPETDAPAYSGATTYAVDEAVVFGHKVYASKVGSNLSNPVTDTTKWTLVGSTNQRQMVDAYNNTQTTNANSIVVSFAPGAIAQALYLGNLAANSISVTVTDPADGVVHSIVYSLIISDSGSSFYNWLFKRIRRKTYFFTGMIPPYVNATVTLTIENTGGVAKCGMCCLGPLIDVGLSQYGLSTEIKDYSSTTFSFDGTSTSVPRAYAKRMSVDVSIDNDLIDSVQQQLADFRQKPVVWVGAVMFDSAIVYGKYSSFKNVIESHPRSKMALQIEGMV